MTTRPLRGQHASLLIRGARVIDPGSQTDATLDVLIADGVVADIDERLAESSAETVIHAGGLVATPGLIDVHTHLREPGGTHSETIASGCAAAARGGFTRIFAMPNTSPACDSVPGVKHVLDRAAEANGVRVCPVATVTRGMSGRELSDFGALADAGAMAFSDDGLPVADAEVMRLALECVRDVDGVIFDHCEDLALTGEGVMHGGDVALRLGLKGIPRVSEAAAVARDCLLSLATGGRLHVCHVSNVDSIEAIRHARSRGAPVTAEVSPHHLTLTDAAVGDYDTHAKMKPPLCDDSDRRALIGALEDGVLDCIATDHAPHAPSLKADSFDAAPFGIIGMESAFAVLHEAFVRPGRWTLAFLVDKLSVAPARVLGGDGGGARFRGWGRLERGGPGDLALFDVDEPYELTTAMLGSKSRNCPWLGATLTGRAVLTVAGGRVVHADADRLERAASP